MPIIKASGGPVPNLAQSPPALLWKGSIVPLGPWQEKYEDLTQKLGQVRMLPASPCWQTAPGSPEESAGQGECVCGGAPMCPSPPAPVSFPPQQSLTDCAWNQGKKEKVTEGFKSDLSPLPNPSEGADLTVEEIERFYSPTACNGK